jgi:hypothetical protein
MSGPGVMKTWSGHSAAFLAFWLRHCVQCRVGLSPPCEGGARGVVSEQSGTFLPMFF